MAFLKGVKNAVEFPVTIVIPAINDKGEEIGVEVTPIVRYKNYKRSEARKLQAEVAKFSREAAEAFESGDMESLFTDRLSFFDDLLRESVLGWRNMPGPDDEDVPFSPEVLDEAIESNFYYTGLMAGLRRALGWGDGGVAGSEAEEVKN